MAIFARFFGMFPRSLKELRSIHALATISMLIALNIAIKLLTIQVTPDIKVSFSFLALAAIGLLYGPVVGLMAGFVTDILGFFLTNRTAAAFDIRFTLVEMLAGFLYRLFLYGLKPDKMIEAGKDEYGNKVKIPFIQRVKNEGFFLPRVILAKATVIVLCNILLTAYFQFSYYKGSDAFWVWNSARVVKNMIQFPVDVVLMTVILPLIYLAFNRANSNIKRVEQTTINTEDKRLLNLVKVQLFVISLTLIGVASAITYSVQLSNDYNKALEKEKKTNSAMKEDIKAIEDILIEKGIMPEPTSSDKAS